jgi:hypothetical protein
MAALDRLFRAHHNPPHPIIAPAIERVEISGVPIVIFDFPARLDLEELSRLAGDHGWRVDHGAADGFSITLRDAIMASGACSDPVDGRGHFLGTLALGNVLFAVDGRHVLVGFGHNVVCHDERGRLSVRQRFFQAPEIAVGYPATAIADIVAMVAMTRTMMAFVNVHEAITRCLAGNNLKDDLELVGHIIWYETRVMRTAASSRASYDEMVAVSNRIRELIRTRPDAAVFERAIARLLIEGRPDLFAPRATLQVARDGSWFAANGDGRVDLAGSPLLARLLRAFVELRIAEPSRGFEVADLQEVGWPGERMAHSSATNRVYVAINALRKAGLGTLIEKSPAGYRLSPRLKVERIDP